MNQFVIGDGQGPPFSRSMFDLSKLNDRTCVERQPSYLLAVDHGSPPSLAFDTARQLHMAPHRPHVKHPQFQAGMSGQQYGSTQATDVSNMDFSGHVPSFSHQPVDADGRLLHGAYSRGKTLTSVQNVNANCDPKQPDFMKVRSYFEPDIRCGSSGMLPAQRVKQIPRAVIAPMSKLEAVERPYSVDRFSSLPKMPKTTHTGKRNPQKDSSDIELCTSKSYGAMVPGNDQFAGCSFTDTACNMTYQHSLGSGNGASYVYSKPLSTAEHSGMVGEYSERLHPSYCSAWSSDIEKSKAFDSVDDGLNYIRPQMVESVLSYQNLARKSHAGHNQKTAIPGAATGKSVQVVALNDANSNLTSMGMTRNCWPSNEKSVSMSRPSETSLDRKGDRRSASSTSTSCSSHLDSGYSGDHHYNSVTLTNTSQSPESCNPDGSCQTVNRKSDHGSLTGNYMMTRHGQNHFNHPGQVQTVHSRESRSQHQQNFAEVPQSLLMVNESHSVTHKERPSTSAASRETPQRHSQPDCTKPHSKRMLFKRLRKRDKERQKKFITETDREPHMQFDSNVVGTSSVSDHRINHHLNTMPVNDRKLSDTEVNAIRGPTKVKQMMVDECAAKPGVENVTEQMKYMSMLQKQIKQFRVKDEATRKLEKTSAQKMTTRSNALLNTGCNASSQGDRNIVQSSCFNLEKRSHDSEFKGTVAKPCASNINCGSVDFNKCKLQQLEMGGNVQDLISKKKALERKRVGLETVESNRDGRGVSFIASDSVTCRNAADEYPGLHDVQRMRMNEAKTKVEKNHFGSGKVIGANPQQLACVMKHVSDADLTSSALENSAEDIVNSWTLVKNERKSQLRNDGSSLASVDSPNIENWKSSPASFAQTEATNFQVSSVHGAPTVDDSCERSNFGKQFKKSVSFSDNVALIASTEEVPNNTVDYVEYVTSFLRKRTNDLKSVEATDDRGSQTGSSSRGSLLSESRSNSSGSRTNSNVSVPESSGSSGDRDSDFYENDGSLCSEEDSEGTTVDETGRIRCSLCHKRWIDASEIYCKDCGFYMSKFQCRQHNNADQFPR